MLTPPIWLIIGAMLLPAAAFAADPLPMNRRGLYVCDGDGRNVRLLLASPEPRFNNCGFPSWSPDGRRIVFDAVPESRRSEGHIYILHVATETPGQLEDLGPGITPEWSPDGSQIAFFMPTSNYPGHTNGTYLMQADGSGRRKVSDLKLPAWSPNGEFLVCSPNWSSSEELQIVDLTTLQHWPVALPDCKFYGKPDFAGDATRMLVALSEPEHRHVVAVIDVSQTPPEIVSRAHAPRAHPRQPVFTPDGSRIFAYRLYDRGATRLLTADLAAETNLLLDLPSSAPASWFTELAWSPDGQWLVFAGHGFDQCPSFFEGLAPSDFKIWRRSGI